jgi:hypothetical protein
VTLNHIHDERAAPAAESTYYDAYTVTEASVKAPALCQRCAPFAGPAMPAPRRSTPATCARPSARDASREKRAARTPTSLSPRR